MESKTSDALQYPPSFDQMVGLIKKLFTDYLTDIQKGAFTSEEIEKSWERYKTLNHLWRGQERAGGMPPTEPILTDEDVKNWENQKEAISHLEADLAEAREYIRQMKEGTAVKWVKASAFKTHKPTYRPYRKPAMEDEGEYDYGEIYITEDDGRIYLDVDNECNYEHQSDERWADYEILDESAGESDAVDWIDVNDQLPKEGGRYWCYVESLTDLGFSYFQWNCDYNDQLQRFSDMTLKNGERITHWRPLAKPPIFKQQKENP